MRVYFLSIKSFQVKSIPHYDLLILINLITYIVRTRNEKIIINEKIIPFLVIIKPLPRFMINIIRVKTAKNSVNITAIWEIDLI